MITGSSTRALILAASLGILPGLHASLAATTPHHSILQGAELPSLSQLEDDGHADGRPIVSELDTAIRQDPAGAFDGSRCEALAPTIRGALAGDPRGIAANYLQALCGLSGDSLLERTTAQQQFLLKMAAYELPSGAFPGERLFEMSTMFDTTAYLMATQAEMLEHYFEVAGGGRRIYYVAVLRDPGSARQQSVRFDLTALASRVLRATAARLDTESLELAEYSPGALMIAVLAQLSDPSPAALVGMARHLADIPGNSLTTPKVRALLEQSDAGGNAQGRILLARSLLLGAAEPELAARAYALATKATGSGLASAELLRAAMLEKGVGTARNRSAAKRAFASAVAAVGSAEAEFRFALLFGETGSALFDGKLSELHMNAAARAGSAGAENSLGYDCQNRSPGSAPADCLRWYEKSSARGNAIATSNLAIAYENGLGVARDTARARALYRQAIGEGNLAAASGLGYLREHDQDAAADTEAAALYRTAAEWGDPWGENNYAVALRDGSGVAKDLEASFEWFRLSAAQDNVSGLMGLAEAYEHGRGVAADQAEAAGHYRYAASKGSVPAMLRLADMILEGRGTEKNADGWRALLVRAADLGSAEAMWRLGEEYAFGGIVPADRELGIAWLRKSAALGNPNGRLKLGIQLSRDEDPGRRAEGRQWLERSAASGDSEAMYVLGYQFETGKGVEQDYAQAIAWYAKAEAADNVRAITALAHMNQSGLGMPPDPVRARALYARAASLGYSVANCNLGDMILSGVGGDKDAEAGWKRIKDAADAGARMCQLKLGVAYRYGEDDISRSLPDAIAYLEKAVAQDVEEAEAQLAEIAMREHEDDDAVQVRSKETLTRLADAGMARAQFLLAEACLLGRPWPRDYVCARQRFEQADASGFPAAAGNVGLLESSGLGGAVDLESAEIWYRKAIDQGAYLIKYDLGRLLLRRNKNIHEALDLLGAVSASNNPAAYLLQRYCAEHADCPVAAGRRAELRRQIAGMSADNKNRVAWSLAIDTMSDREDGRYAVRLLKSLPASKTGDWAVMDTLAAAHARAGEFERAVAVQEDVIARLPDSVNRRERRMVEERLALYRAGKTCDLPF